MIINIKGGLDVVKVKNVFDHLNRLADIKLAEKWDNVGLMLGNYNDEVNKEKQNKRYLIAQQLYFNMSKERKIDYIDLRFNDYIIKYLGDNK